MKDLPTMNAISKKISELLHLTHTPAWTLDRTHELSAAVKSATEDEAKLALIYFVTGMLSASRGVLQLQIEAERSEAERGANGGLTH